MGAKKSIFFDSTEEGKWKEIEHRVNIRAITNTTYITINDSSLFCDRFDEQENFNDVLLLRSLKSYYNYLIDLSHGLLVHLPSKQMHLQLVRLTSIRYFD